MIRRINSLWSIDAANSEDADDYSAILLFLFYILQDVFGDIRNTGDPCIIKNDSTRGHPTLLSTSPATIVLSQRKSSLWAQGIFQLSHELTHYYIQNKKRDKSTIVHWFEETVCEAMALVALDFAAKRWRACILSEINSRFGASIQEYLLDEINESVDSLLRICHDMDTLRQIEATCTRNRQDRKIERNYLYRQIIESPASYKIIKDYTYYINPNKLTIDFDRWYASCPCQAVRVLGAIQPRIK